MKTMLLALAALFLLAPAVSRAGTLDTGVILELLDAGVSDVSIQRYVQRNHFTFDLSSQDLKALKKAGASDDLIGFLSKWRVNHILKTDKKPGAFIVAKRQAG